jgi:hypothetical protein
VIDNGGEVAALAPQIARLHALYLAISKKAPQTLHNVCNFASLASKSQDSRKST